MNDPPLPWDFDSSTAPVLYHYTSVAGARAMVASQAIWLSEYTALNDASEFTYARDRLYDLIRDREVYTDTVARFALMFAVEGLADNTGLMLGSLTARKDDLNQWRSYSANGAGCVVGIDASYLEHDAGVAVRTVLYDDSTVGQLLRTALTVVQDQYDEAPKDTATLKEYCMHAAADLFNIKHPAFADEHEVRIARMLVRGEQGSFEDVGGNRTDGSKVAPMHMLCRDGAFGKTNYVALPLTRQNGATAILSVGLGPTMSATERTEQSAFFAKHGLNVWHSALPYRTSISGR